MTKLVTLLAPSLVNNAAPECEAVDTRGWHYRRVTLLLGATDTTVTKFGLTECDSLEGDFTEVVGTQFGLSPAADGMQSTLPGAGDHSTLWAIDVDLRGRKRYLKPVLAAGDGAEGAYVSVLAALRKGDNSPISSADLGVAGLLRV